MDVLGHSQAEAQLTSMGFSPSLVQAAISALGEDSVDNLAEYCISEIVTSNTSESSTISTLVQSSPGRFQVIREVCFDIQARLGLQTDSVRNQIEHVHALWESFLCRHSDPSEALHDLGSQLLRTQMEWWAKVWSPLMKTDEKSISSFHGEDEAMLRDVCLFLLLWGELGNVRFCPELCCYLFAAARSYIVSPMLGRKPERTFLEEVVKPIYEVFLHETFAPGPGQPPRFKFGKAPAPCNACNYDDWNEVFWDPQRIRRALKLKAEAGKRRGTRLHAVCVEASEVWASLSSVDWAASLKGQKSHREHHSFLPLLVGFHRIFLLLSLAFATLLVLWIRRPFVDSRWLQWSTLGLIAPAWLFFHQVGFQLLTPSLAWRNRFLGLLQLVVYALPGASFMLVLCSLRQWTVIPTIGVLPLKIALGMHAGVSAAILLLALLPRSDNLYNFRFHPTFFKQLELATAVFWLCVLACKFAFDYFVTSYVGRAVDEVWRLHLLWGSQDWLLVPQLVVLILPAALSSLAALPFFEKFAIAIAGALRGIHILGGFKLWLYRHGIGFTHMPGRICGDVLQLPNEQPNVTRFEALRWWNRMSDRELDAFIEIWNSMVDDLHGRDLVSDMEAQRLRIVSAQAVRRGQVPKLLDPLNVFHVRSNMPTNKEARRRIVTFARAAQMHPLPVGTLRQMPSMSVLIPHYSETIRYTRDDLFTEAGSAELLQFLVKYYSDEFRNFASRVSQLAGSTASVDGSTPDVTPDFLRRAHLQRLDAELCTWASLRMQTLWRTVEGICLAYAKALSAVCEQQEPLLSQAERENMVRDKLQVVVAIQRYAKFADPGSAEFDAHQTAAVEAMLEAFGSWLCIAYIDEVDMPEGKRFYSCLIDSSCPLVTGSNLGVGMRKAKLRIELPGFPIMGHGKSDNQNCALIFTRGEVLQTIDANQDAYFEASLFLPLALQEFAVTQNGRRPGILGFREHIFSNVGIMGRMAADNEFAFGTVVQRTMDWPLGARMHYGHPDILDKLQMMQQGGVSKGTRGLNLSEDIFTGIDLMLRGGWTAYREYFHVGKGRDMGFMSVLSFHAKVSMGNGEQAITRQWMRLGLHLPLQRLLGIFYVHIGWYLNQCFVTWSLQAFAFMTAYFSLSNRLGMRLSDEAARLTTSYFGIYYLCFMLASMLPLILEELLENGLRAALGSIASSVLALGPIFSAFQSKLMAHFFESTVHYGGAQYIPTGRGLATAREPFAKLFRTFSMTHFADGFELAVFLMFGLGTDYGIAFYVCIGFTIVSWTFAPFLFNPQQFSRPSQLLAEIRDWISWMCKASGTDEESWSSWAAQQQQVRNSASVFWVLLPSARLLAVACTAALVFQLEPLTSITVSVHTVQSLLVLLPPLAHAAFCLLLAPIKLLGVNLPPLFMALTALGLTSIELSLAAWHMPSLAAVLFHKYMCVRFLLEAADGIAAQRVGGCLLKPLHTACTLWALSFRFARDFAAGCLLSACCVILAAIPGCAGLHLCFLFRAKPKGRQQSNEAGLLEDDDMLLRFFQDYAPQVVQRPFESA